MSSVDPPKFPLRLFRSFCSDERLEELEGDLYEVYNDFIKEKGTKFATLFYWWIVIKSFRPYAFKRKKMKNTGLGNSISFFRHNLVIAWRNLRKHKTTSFINILGLAIGVSAFLAIFSIVQFELSFNKKIPGKENIYRVYTSFSGSFTSLNKGVAMPVGPYVQENFTGLDAVSYFQTYGEKVKIPEENGQLKDLGRQSGITIADSSYFKIANQYEWIVGSPSVALNEPFKVVLTEDKARTYFGNIDFADMMDKRVVYRDSLNVFVSGIVKEPDYNTDFEFTEIISFATIKSSWLKDNYGIDEWGGTNSSSQLFIKGNQTTKVSDIQMQIDDLNEFIAEKNKDLDWVQKFELQPLEELHFNAELGTFDNGRSAAHMPTLTILTVVALAILLIAIFNFINLETAQSTSKSKEVGVRKVMGSLRTNLVGRFLTESVLISFLAVILAIPIAHYGFIYFEEFIPQGVAMDFENPLFWLFLIALVFGVGLLAGIYPAWIVSSYRPVKALNPGTNSKNPGGSFIRKILILFQFLFSQLLIVGTLAIVWQISFMLDKELGFDEEGVMYFYTPYYTPHSKQDLMLNEISKIPQIQSLAVQNNPPVENGYSTNTTKYMGKKGEVVTSAHRKSGDTTFLSFYGIELLAGRNLLPNDTLKEILINETLMSDMGFENPREALGKPLEFGNRDHKIAGVVENFHFRSLHHPIEPMIYLYESKGSCIAMKVNMDEGLQETIDLLTDKWSAIYPDNPLTVYFMNETIERFYKTERRTSKLASIATSIAVFLSCLGLFGLISYTIIQKSKEMGIRKVLGASVLQIGSILSKEFVILIVVAFAISTPISYYAVSRWMEDFAFQTNISWWIYALGGFTSLLIALVSIGIKVWKASAANPIESLKYE